jgi:hypothetical protein
MKSPILFIIFNRPKESRLVFEEIKKAKPLRLYISADGPRNNFKNDIKLCNETRKLTKEIDWDCEVNLNFFDNNIGVDAGVTNAVNWFFSNEDEGIILEDDCLPDQTFFRFCDEMLEKYRLDNRIFMITGNNFQESIRANSSSYGFSIYTHTWGWASWKRSWQNQDLRLESWPELEKSGLLDSLHTNRNVKFFWGHLFENIYLRKHKGACWDYKFLYSCWKDNSLNIVPSVNLISNIGHGENSTHTKDKNSIYANRKKSSLVWPLKHPQMVERNFLADEQDGLDEYFKRTIFDKIYYYAFRPFKLARVIFKIVNNFINSQYRL